MKTLWHNEHIYNTHLDFGLLGELPVEVFYVWHNQMLSNDPYQVQERGYAELTAVTVMIDGREIDISDRVFKNQDLKDDLAYEAEESYRA